MQPGDNLSLSSKNKLLKFLFEPNTKVFLGVNNFVNESLSLYYYKNSKDLYENLLYLYFFIILHNFINKFINLIYIFLI